jgi:ADP-ribose pyrophosphatase YjhB (NUDIX family)
MTNRPTTETQFIYRVAGVCIKQGMVLAHCWDACLVWALPGGRPEMGETSREALAREMVEEIGLQVEIGRLLWIVENFFTNAGQRFHEIGFYYLMSLPENAALANVAADFTGHEGDMPLFFRWLPIVDLPRIILYPGFLQTALANLPATTEHIIQRDAE